MKPTKPLNNIERTRKSLKLKAYELILIACILIWIWLALDIFWIKAASGSLRLLIGGLTAIVQIPTTILLNKSAQQIDRSDRYYKIRNKWFK